MYFPYMENGLFQKKKRKVYPQPNDPKLTYEDEI